MRHKDCRGLRLAGETSGAGAEGKRANAEMMQGERGAVRTKGEALAMGALAFALLMASEAALAVVIGDGVAAWLGGMASTSGAIGLAGQVGYAVMPVALAQIDFQSIEFNSR